MTPKIKKEIESSNTSSGQKSDTKTICRLPLPTGEKSKTSISFHEITWRIFRIMAEFVEGFQFLSESCNEVTFFGAARAKPNDKWYKEAQKLGKMLGEKRYTVITGGGPGIMEAANRGAFSAGANSIGLNIQLPSEQRTNKYVTRGRAFHYFFTRKVMLAASAQAYVFFPGGFGTLDEFFEIVVLIQTGKMQKLPVICVGKEYWDGLVSWINRELVERQGAVDKKEVDIFTIVDTAQEAMDIIATSSERTLF